MRVRFSEVLLITLHFSLLLALYIPTFTQTLQDYISEIHTVKDVYVIKLKFCIHIIIEMAL
jgi:hypothetical protein